MDDSTDSGLLPEFKALVQRVRDESQSGSTHNIPDGMPDEELLIVVKWHRHPLLATNATPEEWQYKVDKVSNLDLTPFFLVIWIFQNVPSLDR